MSSSLINTFFNENPQYLNDIYGINYVQNYDPMYGWTDYTDIFVDSVMLWCAYDMDDDSVKNIVGYFIGIIRLTLALYFDKGQAQIKFARRGKWTSFDDASAHMVDEKEWNAGFIAVNITFHGIDFNALFHPLEKILSELHKHYVILRSIDVTVDCGFISTRKIIEEYLLSRNLASKHTIVDDRRSVGDNCISFTQRSSILEGAKTRTKIYNKFVQIIESSELLQTIGSRLSHLVANPGAAFMDKLKRFRERGYTRIELTVYGSSLFVPVLYKRAMDHLVKDDLALCPTFKVPLQNQWHAVVDKLMQVVAVYVEDKEMFAYCHWWNSLTRRKQGLCRSNIGKDLVETLLANFSFNDRLIHCFHIQQAGSSYDIVKHELYKRADGSTAMTLVPGVSNSLFPSRNRLQTKDVMFKDVGLDIYKNVHIEWPLSRLQRGRKAFLAELSPVGDSFDLSSMREALPLDQPSLHKIESPQSSKYKADYSCLEVNAVYMVIKYGYGLYRGKEYLHLVLENSLMVRCSSGMRALMQPKIEEGTTFKFKAVKIVTVKGVKQTKCEIL